MIIIRPKLKRPIFLGKRGGEDSWRSFETDPHLKLTRKRIFERCLPCLSDLLSSLKRGEKEIDIKRALNCLKLSIILPTYEDCLEFLQKFSSFWPEEYVYGKFGTGDPKKKTRVVVFHLDDENQRLDELKSKAQTCAESLGCAYEIRVTKGCSFPHEVLFGPCEAWKERMEVKNPERVPEIVERLERMLFGPKS